MRPKHCCNFPLLMPAYVFQFFHLSSSPLDLAGAAVDISPPRPVPGPFAIEAPHYLYLSQRLGEFLLFNIRTNDHCRRPFEIRFLLEHTSKLFDGSVVLSRKVKNGPMVG